MSDQFHQVFASALLTGETADLAQWLVNPDARARFAVYRNNVVRGAIEALRAAYPAVNQIVGHNFFSPMAKAYWEASPPSAQTMTLYGAGFDRHIETYAPASDLAYLPDIARLDRAWLEAHHASDAKLLEPTHIAQLAPEALPSLGLKLQPAARLVRTELALAELWSASRAGQVPAERRLKDGPQNILVWRQRGQIHHDVIPAGHASFLESIAEGNCLADALESAGPDQDEQFAGQVFGHGLARGLFTAFHPQSEIS